MPSRPSRPGPVGSCTCLHSSLSPLYITMPCGTHLYCSLLPNLTQLLGTNGAAAATALSLSSLFLCALSRMHCRTPPRPPRAMPRPAWRLHARRPALAAAPARCRAQAAAPLPSSATARAASRVHAERPSRDGPSARPGTPRNLTRPNRTAEQPPRHEDPVSVSSFPPLLSSGNRRPLSPSPITDAAAINGA